MTGIKRWVKVTVLVFSENFSLCPKMGVMGQVVEPGVHESVTFLRLYLNNLVFFLHFVVGVVLVVVIPCEFLCKIVYIVLQ